MSKGKSNLKSMVEYALLGFGSVCMTGVPVLSFMDFPNKAATILVVLICGEALFLMSIALSGKGYTHRIKESFIQLFGLSQKLRNKK